MTKMSMLKCVYFWTFFMGYLGILLSCFMDEGAGLYY